MVLTLDVDALRAGAQPAFDDLSDFMEAAKQIDDWRQIEGADWDQELHALTEATAEHIAEPPMLIFNPVKGYSSDFSVASLLLASFKRTALAMGLPLDRSKLELVRLASRKLGAVKPIRPEEVTFGPVMQNVMEGDNIDVYRFPVPRYHKRDGGRYLGTWVSVINRDPDTGYVNSGAYRVQVHEPDLLGLWMSPGQQGRQICQKYWDRGESCPVVVTAGSDPLTFMASYSKIPWGYSELDYTGGMRGRPLKVINGPHTGLPIPAHAEIAVEGFVPPPSVEARDEGPFGEWPGYYSGGTLGTGLPQPVIRPKAVYYRDNPVLVNQAELWPGAPYLGLRMEAGLLWDQLESAGIQNIAGVYTHTTYMVVVAIKQAYAGHAKQTAMAALGCSAAVRHGRYVVIVDEDIDPTDMKEVFWAMETRVDPARDIELVDHCWSTSLDPRMPPEMKARGEFTNSRAIFYAVRPYEWRDSFPPSSRSDREVLEAVMAKYKDQVPFRGRTF